MEGHVGTVLFEDSLQGGAVPDVAQHHVWGVEEPSPVDGQLHGVQRRLVAVQEHQLAGPELVDLTCELGADRSTRTGD